VDDSEDDRECLELTVMVNPISNVIQFKIPKAGVERTIDIYIHDTSPTASQRLKYFPNNRSAVRRPS
jgi:hypothetical protein